MKRLRAWLRRLAGIVPTERQEQEFSAELESHLQMHIDDNLRAGMTPKQARREAILKLGGIDEGEDGDAGSDAESKHEDGGDGETGAAAELAKGVADVLDHGLEEGDGAAFAVGLLCWFCATQFEDRFAACLLRGHAGAEVVVDVHLEVAVDFIGELQFFLLAWDDACEFE